MSARVRYPTGLVFKRDVLKLGHEVCKQLLKPLVLVTKQGNKYSIFDGAHRACAAKHIGATKIKAQVIATDV